MEFNSKAMVKQFYKRCGWIGSFMVTLILFMNLTSEDKPKANLVKSDLLYKKAPYQEVKHTKVNEGSR